MDKEAVTKLFTSLIEKAFPSKEPQELSVPIVKQFDEELMESIEVLYCAPLEADAHDEGMTSLEIEKMVDNFNTHIHKIKGNFGHAVNTDKFSPVKAWVNPVDCTIGDQFVPEGLPLLKLKFHDQTTWEQRKNGLFEGVSIGARGLKETVGNTNE